jgi:hypothetical protein
MIRQGSHGQGAVHWGSFRSELTDRPNKDVLIFNLMTLYRTSAYASRMLSKDQLPKIDV